MWPERPHPVADEAVEVLRRIRARGGLEAMRGRVVRDDSHRAFEIMTVVVMRQERSAARHAQREQDDSGHRSRARSEPQKHVSGSVVTASTSCQARCATYTPIFQTPQPLPFRA